MDTDLQCVHYLSSVQSHHQSKYCYFPLFVFLQVLNIIRCLTCTSCAILSQVFREMAKKSQWLTSNTRLKIPLHHQLGWRCWGVWDLQWKIKDKLISPIHNKWWLQPEIFHARVMSKIALERATLPSVFRMVFVWGACKQEPCAPLTGPLWQNPKEGTRSPAMHFVSVPPPPQMVKN